jgi:hypothetical protein
MSCRYVCQVPKELIMHPAETHSPALGPAKRREINLRAVRPPADMLFGNGGFSPG